MLDKTIIGILISAIAFVTVYAITPGLINALTKRNMVVKDYNKEVATMVARPGGPSILAGILASEFVLYALFPSAAILAIIITTSLAFLVGFADDRKVLGGWFKPFSSCWNCSTNNFTWSILSTPRISIIWFGTYSRTLFGIDNFYDSYNGKCNKLY